MPDTVAIRAATFARAQEQSAAVPWYARTLLIASASAIVGELWDVSWHISIGRDTFWTPAHLLIQFCAVLGGFTCAWLLLKTTFGKDPRARAASVRVLGFYGPVGAFVVLWGAAAMLTSAPFDNWWHNAYGLDVKILSPPHVILVLGIMSVQLGGLLLVLGCMTRAEGSLRGRLDWFFLCAGGILLTQFLFLSGEYTTRPLMHSAIFYRTVSIGVPVVLIGVAQASHKRWAATAVAAAYTILMLAMMWTLRMFPAEPRLGPVYQRITHLIFPFFPLLVVVAAVCLDLLGRRVRHLGTWLQAALLGAAFLAVMVAVQWPFATFLASPASRNWIFATNDFAYTWPPNHPAVRHVFLAYEATRAVFWRGMGIALVSAILSARFGLAWGSWMRDIRR